MTDITTLISEIGLVPVIVIDDINKAVPLAKALAQGGIPVAEITFRTAAGRDAIAEISKHVPEVCVGAGTIHNIEQAKSAVDAGAKFIVTPGFHPAVVQWCLDHNVVIFPGCSSPRDLENALEFDLKVVKFFPAEVNGGVKALKAFSGPYANLKFMPTGGINETNVGDYLALGNVIACGGVWMVPSALIQNNQFDEIAALCHSAIAKMLDFKLLHVGINSKDQKDALDIVHTFAGLFSQNVTEFPNAYFAGSMVEVIKGPFLGTHGHIAIQTADIDRAVAYFKRQGIAFNPETENRDASGKLITYYFKEEVAGFAIHLRRK